MGTVRARRTEQAISTAHSVPPQPFLRYFYLVFVIPDHSEWICPRCFVPLPSSLTFFPMALPLASLSPVPPLYRSPVPLPHSCFSAYPFTSVLVQAHPLLLSNSPAPTPHPPVVLAAYSAPHPSFSVLLASLLRPRIPLLPFPFLSFPFFPLSLFCFTPSLLPPPCNAKPTTARSPTCPPSSLSALVVPVSFSVVIVQSLFIALFV